MLYLLVNIFKVPFTALTDGLYFIPAVFRFRTSLIHEHFGDRSLLDTFKEHSTGKSCFQVESCTVL